MNRGRLHDRGEHVRRPDIPERIVLPAKGDRSQKCPVCVRKVPDLLVHVNARHLPWFVFPPTACSECYIQFNDRDRLERHAFEMHSNRDVRIPPQLWSICMREYFEMIADALGINVEQIPLVVREKGLANQSMAPIPDCDMAYYNDPSLGRGKPIDPCNPVTLLDCSHWRVLLKLNGLVRVAVASHLVKSAFPEDGYTFYPPPQKNQQPNQQSSKKQQLGKTQVGSAQQRGRNQQSGAQQGRSGAQQGRKQPDTQQSVMKQEPRTRQQQQEPRARQQPGNKPQLHKQQQVIHQIHQMNQDMLAKRQGTSREQFGTYPPGIPKQMNRPSDPQGERIERYPNNKWFAMDPGHEQNQFDAASVKARMDMKYRQPSDVNQHGARGVVPGRNDEYSRRQLDYAPGVDEYRTRAQGDMYGEYAKKIREETKMPYDDRSSLESARMRSPVESQARVQKRMRYDEMETKGYPERRQFEEPPRQILEEPHLRGEPDNRFDKQTTRDPNLKKMLQAALENRVDTSRLPPDVLDLLQDLMKEEEHGGNKRSHDVNVKKARMPNNPIRDRPDDPKITSDVRSRLSDSFVKLQSPAATNYPDIGPARDRYSKSNIDEYGNMFASQPSTSNQTNRPMDYQQKAERLLQDPYSTRQYQVGKRTELQQRGAGPDRMAAAVVNRQEPYSREPGTAPKTGSALPEHLEQQLKTLSEGMAVLTDAVMHLNKVRK